MISWVYLISAGLLEIGWPLGLKLAQQDGYRWQGILMAMGMGRIGSTAGLCFA